MSDTATLAVAILALAAGTRRVALAGSGGIPGTMGNSPPGS